MAMILLDRAKDGTSTTGTGTLTITGPYPNFISATGIGDGNYSYFGLVDDSPAQFEVFKGTYSSGDSTISRDIVLVSSSGGQRINILGSGYIFITQPASKTIIEDTSGNVIFEKMISIGGYFPSTTGNRALLLGDNSGVPSIVNSEKFAAIYNSSGEMFAVNDGGRTRRISPRYHWFAGSGEVVTFDIDNGLVQRALVVTTGTTFNFNNAYEPFTILTQQYTGNATVANWGSVRWQSGVVPALTSASGKIDTFTFIPLPTGGFLGYVAGGDA